MPPLNVEKETSSFDRDERSLTPATGSGAAYTRLGAETTLEEHVNNAAMRKRFQNVQHRVATQSLRHEADKKERTGWYIYEWANGAFFYVAMNFIPLMVTDQAREIAISTFCNWDEACLERRFDWATDYYHKGICRSDRKLDNMGHKCLELEDSVWIAEVRSQAKQVNLLGLSINYASIYLYGASISVLFQLLFFVFMGSFADFGSNRKRMWLFFNTTGILTLFVVVFLENAKYYWVNELLWIIAVVCFSFSLVFYNSYLPLLVLSHPSVLDVSSDIEPSSVEKQITHSMSVKGMAIGYMGQFIFLVATLAIMRYVSAMGYLSTRVAVACSGVWLVIFTTITFASLRTRPGPTMPAGQSYCSYSVTSFCKTLKSLKRLRQLGRFLLAYFVFSDGVSTLASTAAIFGQEELKMSVYKISVGLLEASVCAVVGCFFFKWIHDRFKVNSRTIIIINLLLMGSIPIYAMVSMKNEWEFYVAIFVYGFCTGSQQAFTRSLFSHFVPSGREAEYFSFYQITDRGTAWLGPMVVAIINQYASYRIAFASIVIFYVVGCLLLLRFDADLAEVEKAEFDQDDIERKSDMKRSSPCSIILDNA